MSPLGDLVEVHMNPLTGENELAYAGGDLGMPDGLPAEQRQALPVTALPDGWERTGRNTALPLRFGQEVQALPRLADLTGIARTSLQGAVRERRVAPRRRGGAVRHQFLRHSKRRGQPQAPRRDGPSRSSAFGSPTRLSGEGGVPKPPRR